MVDSPAEVQQETNADENLGSAIADTFDQLEAADGDNDAEMEVSEETETATLEADEGDTEAGEVEEPDGEPELELAEEVQEAADSDYKEPAPERWPDDIRKVYDELPPVARKAMMEGIYKPMQRTYTQQTQELAKMRGRVEPMLETLEHHRNDFERMGVNPAEAFKTQMAWVSHLNKVGAEQGIRDMQEAYGVGTPQGKNGQENVYLTPTERAMQDDINTLKTQLKGQQDTAKQTSQNVAQQRADGFKNEVQSTLKAFINEKTEDGKPMHPHMQKVASKIGGIIRGGLVNKSDEYGQQVPIRDQIAQAYTMACNLDPSLRTPVVNKRQANRVKAAQKVSVVTKAPAGSVDADEMDMSSFIEKTYDQLDGR